MKKLFSLLLLSFLSVTFVQAQTETEDQVHQIVEKMPVFPGGEQGLMKFIVENVRYPESAIDMGIEGTVYVGFVVNKKGDLENIEVMRGVSPELDTEALRVAALCNGWTPGEQQGKAVNVKYYIPIKFVLTGVK